MLSFLTDYDLSKSENDAVANRCEGTQDFLFQIPNAIEYHRFWKEDYLNIQLNVLLARHSLLYLVPIILYLSRTLFFFDGSRFFLSFRIMAVVFQNATPSHPCTVYADSTSLFPSFTLQWRIEAWWDHAKPLNWSPYYPLRQFVRKISSTARVVQGAKYSVRKQRGICTRLRRRIHMYRKRDGT